jgi:hypothetical protein
MNRYVTEGAVFDASTGGRVGFCSTAGTCHLRLAECAAHALSKFPVDNVVVAAPEPGGADRVPRRGSVKFFRSVKAMRGSASMWSSSRWRAVLRCRTLFHELASTVGRRRTG